MTKISSLTALTGAGVDTAADLVTVVDMSETGSARNKKMTVDELALALGEAIDDRVAGLLVEGSNVTLTYDDATGELTIDAATPSTGDITGFNEAVDDRVAALILAGSGITKTYNDAAGTLTISATGASALLLPPEWAPNVTAAADVYIPAVEAMTISQGNAAIGTGTIAYSKSTTAAPSTFSATTLPATLEAGAWLKVSFTAVTGFCATHLKRTA